MLIVSVMAAPTAGFAGSAVNVTFFVKDVYDYPAATQFASGESKAGETPIYTMGIRGVEYLPLVWPVS